MLDILDYINEQHLLEEGDGVLLGVSGGADSVCLLFQFLKVMESIDISLHVVYVEHGIRGEESVEDGRFVKKLCEQIGMPFTFVSVDAPAFAEDEGMSLEQAARTLRYEAFLDVAYKEGLNKVATAHNANDNAETILFQMIRGSGAKGISGIDVKSKRKNYEIIRPLLNTSRKEVEEYLQEIGQSYREDVTNASDDFARNKIRHQVIPVLEEINAKAVAHINQAGAIVSRMYDGVMQETLELLDGIMGENGLRLEPLKKLDYDQRADVILAYLRYLGVARDVSKVHIEMLNELIFMEVGKEYHLPHGNIAKVTYHHLKIKQDTSSESGGVNWKEIVIPKLEEGETYQVSAEDVDVSFYLRKAVQSEEIPRKIYAKRFAYDKIMGNIVLRHRRAGDYFVIHPDGGKKLLQDYFVEEKIPQEERDRIWLLCQDSKVIWILGHRNSEDYRIDDETKYVLEVEFWRN